MAKKIEQKVVYAFIDSQNLNLGVKSQGWTLDFAKFRVYLEEKYHVSKAYIFIGMIPQNQLLYKSLKDAGYICIFKPTLEHREGKKVIIKGNVDAELVLHTMIQYDQYSKAIIVSGDGDFWCLADYLNKQNKLAKIIVPNSKYSSLLRQFAQYIVNVDLFRNKVQKKRGIPAG
ncbi:MAG: NYN domain-containing protein [Microgenomates group bacterium]